ncbi:MAG: PilT/PilU family type 4a pilus ATPase [Myxococcales bacterium]|nr:PilT/PilU family type 4a pilus ATPase [Myxococcales bacterium]
MDKEKLNRLLLLGSEKGASDIHFQVGHLPLYRFNGELVQLKYKVLTADDTAAIARQLAAESSIGELGEFKEIDFAYELPDESRFRVNICRERRFYNIVLRVIPLSIESFEALNLPSVLADVCQIRRGLVLVTGPTGMGKSTTLATMLQQVNQTRKCKLVTIEDPLEFIFKPDQSIITQREIGTDTDSFSDALRAALRQDPDVIMVGEIRDAMTVDTALKAAETGHAVFSSIHTSDVVTTLRRIVSLFPTDEQSLVMERLADNVKAIVSLRLLPNKKRDGRVPAVEIMRTTRSIRECIRDQNRTHEIVDHICRGREHMQMQSFDQHLLDLYRANKIARDTAIDGASNPQDLITELALSGESEDPGMAESDSLDVDYDASTRFEA